MKDTIIGLLRPLFRLVDARLDKSRFLGGGWQIVKWRLKYLLNRPQYTPDFDTLLAQPHRRWLTGAVAAMGADGGVLDVGCGKGLNLILLAQSCPGIKLEGIDISRSVLQVAREELDARGFPGIKVELGGAESLSRFPDHSFDVVLSDAVLMYLPPATIVPALREMLRIARRGVVLGTWHQDMPIGGEVAAYEDGTWIYDYRRLMAEDGGCRIEIQPYPDGAWQNARWQRYGKIVTFAHR